MNLREAFDAMLRTMYSTVPQPDREFISPAEYARRRARNKEHGVPMYIPSRMPWKETK